MTQSDAREKGQAAEKERGRRGRGEEVAARLHLAFYCQGAQILSKDFELGMEQGLGLGRICILQRKRQQDMREDADNGTRVETCRCLGSRDRRRGRDRDSGTCRNPVFVCAGASSVP